MGTALQDQNLTAKDFGGEAYEGCNENLIFTKPDAIEKVHRAHLEAGADILETNTFGATPLVLGEYQLQEKAHATNVTAARLARKLAEEFSTPEKPRFVAGSIGPTTKAISVTGGIEFEDLQNHFYIQAKGLWEGGADYLLIETCQDSRNIKAALFGIDQLIAEKKQEIPIAISGTIEPMGTMLAGQSVEALYASFAHRDLLYMGLNCATGPEFMTDPIRSLSQLSRFPIACVPNAGLPDENGCYLETPEMVALVLERFIQKGWLNLIGGCCGTHSGHIQALAALANRYPPRKAAETKRSFLSGVDYLEVTDDLRPVLVGERTNVIGSRKFKELICSGGFDQAAEVARSQIKGGAQIIDICLANPDRDELEDMRSFLKLAIQKIRVPLMIDSTDEKVIEASLPYCQGKAIINSINLEDGEERFEKVIPLVKKYGAAVVVGTIDDDPQQGMGVTRQRKLQIAERSYQLLTEKYGLPGEDIYWDPLVFPCATGDTQYIGSAVETIEGLRLLKSKFPNTKTILGISNVSFGLPPQGREVLNSVFLYHCVKAGLDLAIVNSEKLERYPSLPEEERLLAENLLFNRGSDVITEFANYFRQRKQKQIQDRASIPLAQRLSSAIIEGSKDGLFEDLEEALQSQSPLEVINGPLMAGMDEVGKLFNDNKLIVAEVLQSAEAMKAAVAYLEPKMEKKDASLRGKVLLATVKGDVHDIGKNLVEIILSNNGFQVINLGIKVPPEQLIQAIREHQPNVVGLSGLLVKSAQQMVVTAEDFSKAGVNPPLLVGGAALSESFVDRKIAAAYSGTVSYASDAMHGLELAKTIVDPRSFETLKSGLEQKRKNLSALPQRAPQKEEVISSERAREIQRVEAPPLATDFERHILRNTPIDQIWRFINPLMLYGRHLGIKGQVVKKLTALENDPRARAQLESEQGQVLKIWDTVEEVKQDYRGSEIFKPSAVYQFFLASSENNRLHLYDGAQNKFTFDFPRQNRVGGLCIADYVDPDLSKKDNVALFVTTVGRGVRELAHSLKNRGDYLKSHILQALAIESAEAYAEFLHAQLRKMWGFPDPPEMTLLERFQAKYRGKRYSFGYPACPRLEDQRLLFELLNPSEMGVELTEGFMMDPEASVSALVFHHPQATYFSVGTSHEENRT